MDAFKLNAIRIGTLTRNDSDNSGMSHPRLLQESYVIAIKTLELVSQRRASWAWRKWTSWCKSCQIAHAAVQVLDSVDASCLTLNALHLIANPACQWCTAGEAQ